MSKCALNIKKTRKLAALTGLPLERVLVDSGGVWAEGRTAEDRHYSIHRITGEYRLIANPIHWSSCAR